MGGFDVTKLGRFLVICESLVEKKLLPPNVSQFEFMGYACQCAETSEERERAINPSGDFKVTKLKERGDDDN